MYMMKASRATSKNVAEFNIDRKTKNTKKWEF